MAESENPKRSSCSSSPLSAMVTPLDRLANGIPGRGTSGSCSRNGSEGLHDIDALSSNGHATSLIAGHMIRIVMTDPWNLANASLRARFTHLVDSPLFAMTAVRMSSGTARSVCFGLASLQLDRHGTSEAARDRFNTRLISQRDESRPTRKYLHISGPNVPKEQYINDLDTRHVVCLICSEFHFYPVKFYERQGTK